MKAKYIGKHKDRNGYAVHLFYNYRGYEYMITDEHNGYSESLVEKHRYEQKKIDKVIEEKERQAHKETTEEIDFNKLIDWMFDI